VGEKCYGTLIYKYMNIFIYGSLLFESIREPLIGRKVEVEEAILHNYEIYKINYGLAQSDYPILKSEAGKKVYGLLMKNLNKVEIDILSFYEGDEYILNEVVVKTKNIKQNAFAYFPVKALVYKYGDLWSIGEFERNILKKYSEQIIPQTIAEYNKMCDK